MNIHAIIWRPCRGELAGFLSLFFILFVLLCERPQTLWETIPQISGNAHAFADAAKLSTVQVCVRTRIW